MSRGRTTVDLADLASATAGMFGDVRVAEVTGRHVVRLWDDSDQGGLMAGPPVRVLLDSTMLGAPTDRPWRTTADDIRSLVWDLVQRTCPTDAMYLAQCMVWGTTPHTDTVYSARQRSAAERAVDKARRSVIQTDLVKQAPRRGKPAKASKASSDRHPIRRRSSAVTTTLPDGRVLVNGVEVKCLLPEDREVRP